MTTHLFFALLLFAIKTHELVVGAQVSYQIFMPRLFWWIERFSVLRSTIVIKYWRLAVNSASLKTAWPGGNVCYFEQIRISESSTSIFLHLQNLYKKSSDHFFWSWKSFPAKSISSDELFLSFHENEALSDITPPLPPLTLEFSSFFKSPFFSPFNSWS